MAQPRNLDAYIGFWCDQDLQSEITAKAKTCGMKRSDWIRTVLRAAVDCEDAVPPSGPRSRINLEARAKQ